ncbi:MAG: hypothetical protein JSU67_03745 [Gammaproteobacteria bacterium]|nr:MAG: hypothetical protein JSU67_03745 [Gammaproteobacteria bacterium]
MAEHRFELRATFDYSGEAKREIVDYIEGRMRQCPVSINLKEPADYRIDLEFVS